MKYRPASRLTLITLLLGLMTLAPAMAQTGTVTGVITDADGNPLPGAAVRVEGTLNSTATDVSGTYRLAGVAAGDAKLVISYLGFETKTIEITVADGDVGRADTTLDPQTFGDTVEVISEPIRHGQAKALNQQKTAINIKNIVASDQIGNFPDPNAAEATQRIPGITLQRDQGEGRYVIVRGTEPRFNSTTVNGERIPSPEGDTRFVALDVIPADLLEAIEVSKAITPDMDGDAIGGTVDLVTKRAPENRRIVLDAGAGHNDQTDDGLSTMRALYGGRFGNENRSGILISGSFLDTDRGSDNYEVAYDDGEVEELELRDYTINRERTGMTFDFDHRTSDSSDFFVRGIWNDFSDQEFRRRKTEVVPDGEIERELKDRFEVQEILSVSLGGSNLFGSTLIADYRLTISNAEESEPDRLDTTFKQEDVVFAPSAFDPNNIQNNPMGEDITAFVLDDAVNENNLTQDEEVVASANLQGAFSGDNSSGIWKFGLKYRDKSKDRNNEVIVYEGDDVFLSGLVDSGFDATPFLDGRYDLGAFPSADGSRNLLSILEAERDFEEDAADYDASEETTAAYGMVELAFNNNLTFLGGLRWEATDTSYTASEIVFDVEGDFAGLSPVSGGSSYDELLPMVHLRYAIDQDSNVRGAITRTLSRPNFSDLAPFQLILEEDNEIERGNPELDVTTAWNLDILYERYFTTVGVFSAGIFAKQIEDVIFNGNLDIVRDGENFEVIQPFNGGDGDLQGFELAYQNTFRNLPGALSGLGLYFNYTYADSEGALTDRDVRLPGQAENVANLAVSYERGGFSGRLSLNHHSEYLEEVGGDPSEDIWIDEHQQLDLSANYRFNNNWTVYLEVINLTDEEYRVYEGTPDRPIQAEFYSWWGTLGVKWSF